METARPLLAAFWRDNNEQCRLSEEIPGTVFSCRPEDIPFALQPRRSEKGQRTRTSILLLLGLQGSTKHLFEMCCSSLHHRNKACGQCRTGNALCELAKTGLLWITVPVRETGERCSCRIIHLFCMVCFVGIHLDSTMSSGSESVKP